jgi:hypothetical protein
MDPGRDDEEDRSGASIASAPDYRSAAIDQ